MCECELTREKKRERVHRENTSRNHARTRYSLFTIPVPKTVSVIKRFGLVARVPPSATCHLPVCKFAPLVQSLTLSHTLFHVSSTSASSSSLLCSISSYVDQIRRHRNLCRFLNKNFPYRLLQPPQEVLLKYLNNKMEFRGEISGELNICSSKKIA